MNLAMADNHDYNVPAEKIDFYRKHGWVVLEDVVSPAEIKRSARRIHSLDIYAWAYRNYSLLSFIILVQGILDDFVAGRRSTSEALFPAFLCPLQRPVSSPAFLCPLSAPNHSNLHQDKTGPT